MNPVFGAAARKLAPYLKSKLDKNQKRFYYDIRTGYRVSKAQYLRSSQGKTAKDRRLQNIQLRNRLGPPPPGLTWIEIAEKYSEKFEGYVDFG